MLTLMFSENRSKQKELQSVAGTHSLGFLLAPVAHELLGAQCSPWVQVFHLAHQHLEHLEGPKNQKRAVIKTKCNPPVVVHSKHELCCLLIQKLKPSM